MRPAPRHSRSTQPNVGCSDAAEGRALFDLPPPTGAALAPWLAANVSADGGVGSLHPDAARVLDADAGRLSLTPAEADAVAIEADILDGKHGGGFYGWVYRILNDIRHGRRDRHGRRHSIPRNP